MPIFDADEVSEATGLDRALLAEAIALHRSRETPWPVSMYRADGQYIGTASIGDRPEHAAVIGPVRARGGPNGVILRHGRVAAEWGDTRRPDMTFSVTKSYLALLTGLALADGLIGGLDDRVGASVPEPWFTGPRNGAVTWRHLLQLTSEWTGTLWGKPDAADHHRIVGGAGDVSARKGEARVLSAPGTYFEYNDVRVNLLAAALTHRFGDPLPDVLRERVMDPIGASPEWEWHGYDGAAVLVDGVALRAVSGGGHWGGGMFIGSRDHARMGQLVLQDGVWEGRRILPEGWVRQILTPSALNPHYGMLWWLNGGAAIVTHPSVSLRYPGAPADGVFALGAGTHLIWIAPSQDLVAVVRWIDGDAVDPFLACVSAAVLR